MNIFAKHRTPALIGRKSFISAFFQKKIFGGRSGVELYRERQNMNELLKLDENGNQTVNARELHLKLGVGRDFSTWIKNRIERWGNFCN